MGGGPSRPPFLSYQEASGRFLHKELGEVGERFKKVAEKDLTKQNFVSQYHNEFSQFANNLFDALLNGNKQNKQSMTFQEFLQGYAMIAKGKPEEKLSFGFEVLDQKHNGAISLKDFRDSLNLLFECAFDYNFPLLWIPTGSGIPPTKEEYKKIVKDFLRKLPETLNGCQVIKYDVYFNWIQRYRFIVDYIEFSLRRIFNKQFEISQALKSIQFQPPPLMIRGDSELLSNENAALLRSWLPEPYCQCHFYKIFSTKTLGFALGTLYRMQGAKPEEVMNEPSIIIIKDDRDHIFGGFVTKSWRKNSDRFYGSEESFLFSMAPKRELYPYSGDGGHIMFSNNDLLALGGKYKHFAIELDSELMYGKSNADPINFSCPRLAASPEFTCVSVELWGLIDVKNTKKLFRIDSDDELDIPKLKESGIVSGVSVWDREESWVLDNIKGVGYSKFVPPPLKKEESPDDPPPPSDPQ